MECFQNDRSKTQYYVVILDRLQGHSRGLERALELWIRGPFTVSSKCNLDMVPAEMWYRNKQNVAHLCVFGVTAYTHISSDLHLLKLGPRATQLTLIGYFGAGSYKLLDQETDSMYSERNVCFEEVTANLTKRPQWVE